MTSYESIKVCVLKRLTAVSTAPALIIVFMLFLAHLQPLDAGGLCGGEAARTGRLVLVLLPYGLVALCLVIGGDQLHLFGPSPVMATRHS